VKEKKKSQGRRDFKRLRRQRRRSVSMAGRAGRDDEETGGRKRACKGRMDGRALQFETNRLNYIIV
jgi:hypothetical protein